MVARKPIIHAGRVIPKGDTLPEDVDAVRLVQRGLACDADGQCPQCDCRHATPKRSARKRD